MNSERKPRTLGAKGCHSDSDVNDNVDCECDSDSNTDSDCDNPMWMNKILSKGGVWLDDRHLSRDGDRTEVVNGA